MLGEQNNSLHLDIAVSVRSSEGKEITNLSQRIERHLESQQAALIQSEGIRYSNRFQVPPGSYGVWFAIRDSNSGRLGSIVTSLTVQ